MKLKNRTIIYTLALMIAAAVDVTPVSAGNINSAEQSILNFASGTFEHEGVVYRATSSAIAIAKSKMLEDDVDLTQEEADNYMRQALLNIQKGIDEGYLTPVSEQPQNNNQSDQNNTDDKNESDKKTDSDNKKDNSEQATLPELKYQDELQSADESEFKEADDELVLIRDGKLIMKSEKVIKNTGYDISGMYSVIILGIFVFAVTVMLTVMIAGHKSANCNIIGNYSSEENDK
ncbi:MAG: hypothetical protein E7254_06615 [Lachnospiraceae bacterium]|nr:hypothetical protein [Lachnospiraceae bacterium]